MKAFSKKDLLFIFVSGVLIICSVFFFFKGVFAQKELEEYKKEIFTRAYESSVQLLYEYAESENTALSVIISSRLSELPLTQTERMFLKNFVSDIANSEENTPLREKTVIYARTIADNLQSQRESLYKNGGTYLLQYGDMPVIADEDDTTLEIAKKILKTKHLTEYTRTSGDKTYECFRGNGGYVEFDSLLPVRALLCYPADVDSSKYGCTVFVQSIFGDSTAYISESEEKTGVRYVFENKNVRIYVRVLNNSIRSFEAEEK